MPQHKARPSRSQSSPTSRPDSYNSSQPGRAEVHDRLQYTVYILQSSCTGNSGLPALLALVVVGADQGLMHKGRHTYR